MQKPVSKLLPSKQFLLIILACTLSVVIILYISSKIGTKNTFTRDSSVKNRNITLQEAIILDSNNNGIPDWEESLWGLDPKSNGLENKKTIEAKKIQAGIPIIEPIPQETDRATETEQFSKNLLATVLALKETNGLTPEAIANLGNAFGQNIDSKRSLIPAYFTTNIQTINDTQTAYIQYDTALRSVITKYDLRGLGTELQDIPEVMADDGKTTAKNALITMGEYYQSFAKEIIAIPTPKGIAPFALALANSGDAIGVALKKIATIKEDALGGMIGVDEYTTHSEKFLTASVEIVEYLIRITQ